jgi:hypothetical protein
MTGFVKPLASRLWFRRIERIANGELADIECALRHAAHLLQLAPLRFRQVLRLAVDEDCFEALLANGEYDSAARHLIAQPAALTVEEQAGRTRFRATIGCVILNRAVHGTGESVATAILAAWTSCLLALESDCSDFAQAS